MLLLPFSILYGLVVIIRNWLYNRNILRSARFNLPLICVGNLSVGGTGKSPMVEFLISRLKNQVNLAILSRGYKRKTTGYALASESTRRFAELQISDALAQRERELVAEADKLGDLPVLW